MGGVDSLFAGAVGDRQRGAAEVERRLIDGLLQCREQWTAETLARGADRLLAGQAAMANMRNLARRLVTKDHNEIEALLKERSRQLAGMDERLAAAAWPVAKDCRRILTLSRSSAVAAVLRGASRRGWRGEVVVFDGSPAGCGIDQARRLADVIPSIRSQPDAAMSSWFTENHELVVIGADAVSPARLVNACGTRALLELAAAHAARVLLVADSGKDLPDDEIDRILAAGPVATEPGPNRCWSIFEAAPMALVSDRVAG